VETIESIVKNIKSVGSAKNVRLVLDNHLSVEDSESLVIQVDQPKLEQVFLNIASNSVKFSPENSELKVTISISSQGIEGDQCNENFENLTYAGALAISFVDQGVGIDPEDLSRVFGEFTQFNSTILQGGGGSGLGLFITRNIVECHNGTIYVYSDGIGRGTRFELKLAAYECNKNSNSCDDNVILLAESISDNAEAEGNYNFSLCILPYTSLSTHSHHHLHQHDHLLHDDDDV